MKRFIDLFAGIGGFRLAMEPLGLKCVFTSEIDKHASDAYANHFNSDVHGDITKIDAKDIPQHDVLCAGFPCQTFSLSGLKKGFDDNRGVLFYDIVRIAKHHQPKVLLLENVRNILSIDDRKVLQAIILSLSEIGYKVHYSVLNASDFGVPHSRLRVYFVCLHKDANLIYQEPFPLNEQIYLIDVLEKDVDEKLYPKRTDYTINTIEQPFSLRPIYIGRYPVKGQLYKIYNPKGHARTLTATGGSLGRTTGLYYINGRVRRLSMTECKRIMGFPDNYDIKDTAEGMKQIGNAVIPKMIEIVYRGIRKNGRNR